MINRDVFKLLPALGFCSRVKKNGLVAARPSSAAFVLCLCCLCMELRQMLSDVSKSATTVSTHNPERLVDLSQISIPETTPKLRMQTLTTLLANNEEPYHIESHDLSLLGKWIDEAVLQSATQTLELILILLSKVAYSEILCTPDTVQTRPIPCWPLVERLDHLVQHEEGSVRDRASALVQKWCSGRSSTGEPPLKRSKLNPPEEVVQPQTSTQTRKSVSWAPEDTLVQVKTFRKSDAIAVLIQSRSFAYSY